MLKPKILPLLVVTAINNYCMTGICASDAANMPTTATITTAANEEQTRSATSAISSSSSSSSTTIAFEQFQKILCLDELPALLDRAIAYYGNALTPVVFLDFDDCSAQRQYIVNILGTTHQFIWLSSPERRRQLAPTLPAIVAKALNLDDETENDSWNIMSQVPDANLDLYENEDENEPLTSRETIYQPVNNLSAVIAALKTRYAIIKVCSGLPSDHLRLAVLEKNGLTKEDYLYAGRNVTKVEAIRNYIVELRKKSDGKENNYLTILVDNDFPDAKEKTGKSAAELAETLSDLVTQTNNENSESTPLVITGLFVHDTRFLNMLETARPQIRTEIEHSLEARIALLNIQKERNKAF